MVIPYRRIVILTGAGVSAESGIRTFRASDGLWEEHRVEDVATPEGYAADPVLVQRFYNERRRQLVGGIVRPNAAHEALARLEAEFPGEFLLVTQNIDDLHERAGSRGVIHMHGELLKVRCEHCGRLTETRADVSVDDICAHCGTGGLRPHVVWFGEMPLRMPEIDDALQRCDLFAAIGTSGNVYPAAGYVRQAARAGAHTVQINLEPTAINSDFDEIRLGPAGEQVPAWVDELLGS
ncbi:Sir2 family NAD+-dependent deacetylase [Homoserinimonas sp. OAct 916]|uniref:Sir2 family NAD+-dependent deacetylase n=1 Tax=Homoserinimonas sp. OAct 916 TaxID=2211450 RepID=UPI000DBE4785|nr:Sir2 family NAD+-dependent deacetylase [Homoserinimonas sp. OAct 916]